MRWEADQADEVLGVAEGQVGCNRRRSRRQRALGQVRSAACGCSRLAEVPDLLCVLPVVLGPERVAWLADRARIRRCPAA